MSMRYVMDLESVANQATEIRDMAYRKADNKTSAADEKALWDMFGIVSSEKAMGLAMGLNMMIREVNRFIDIGYNRS